MVYNNFFIYRVSKHIENPLVFNDLTFKLVDNNLLIKIVPIFQSNGYLYFVKHCENIGYEKDEITIDNNYELTIKNEPLSFIDCSQIYFIKIKELNKYIRYEDKNYSKIQEQEIKEIINKIKWCIKEDFLSILELKYTRKSLLCYSKYLSCDKLNDIKSSYEKLGKDINWGFNFNDFSSKKDGEEYEKIRYKNFVNFVKIFDDEINKIKF